MSTWSWPWYMWCSRWYFLNATPNGMPMGRRCHEASCADGARRRERQRCGSARGSPATSSRWRNIYDAAQTSITRASPTRGCRGSTRQLRGDAAPPLAGTGVDRCPYSSSICGYFARISLRRFLWGPPGEGDGGEERVGSEGTRGDGRVRMMRAPGRWLKPRRARRRPPAGAKSAHGGIEPRRTEPLECAARVDRASLAVEGNNARRLRRAPRGGRQRPSVSRARAARRSRALDAVGAAPRARRSPCSCVRSGFFALEHAARLRRASRPCDAPVRAARPTRGFGASGRRRSNVRRATVALERRAAPRVRGRRRASAHRAARARGGRHAQRGRRLSLCTSGRRARGNRPSRVPCAALCHDVQSARPGRVAARRPRRTSPRGSPRQADVSASSTTRRHRRRARAAARDDAALDRAPANRGGGSERRAWGPRKLGGEGGERWTAARHGAACSSWRASTSSTGTARARGGGPNTTTVVVVLLRATGRNRAAERSPSRPLHQSHAPTSVAP